MENLKGIIKEIMGYRKELGINPTDDMILDCSTRIFNSQNIEVNKKPIYKKTQNPNLKATSKQIYFLKNHGIKNPENLSLSEASKKIEQLKSINP